MPDNVTCKRYLSTNQRANIHGNVARQRERCDGTVGDLPSHRGDAVWGLGGWWSREVAVSRSFLSTTRVSKPTAPGCR